MFSAYGNNFVKTMLRLAKQNKELQVVNDQLGKPTSAHELAKVVFQIIPQLALYKGEVFHFAQKGFVLGLLLLKKYLDKLLKPNLKPINT